MFKHDVQLKPTNTLLANGSGCETKKTEKTQDLGINKPIGFVKGSRSIHVKIATEAGISVIQLKRNLQMYASTFSSMNKNLLFS